MTQALDIKIMLSTLLCPSVTWISKQDKAYS